jgi:hypothetical protein
VIGGRRSRAYVAVALIVGAALALAVALSGNEPSSGSSTGVAATAQAPGSILGDAASGALGAADPAAADPAKEEPVLDKFVSKDPFIPLGVVSPVNPVNPVNPGGNTTLFAHVKIDGTSYTVVKGDEVPGGAPVFTVSAVTSGDVTFAVIKGALKNGDTSIVVNVGESVKVTLDNGHSYTIKVESVGKSGGGGTNGHTISVLSITESGGTALVTIEVDGKTYADKKVGSVIVTTWGEVEVVAINVGSQTVTLMHGDQTITLRAGQVVVK